MQEPCSPGVDQTAILARVETSGLVVVGSVAGVRGPQPGPEPGFVDIRPEAFLKGNVTAGLIRFRAGEPGACADPAKPLAEGDRVLLIARPGDSTEWPGPQDVFLLRDGNATSFVRGDHGTIPEPELIDLVRRQTNQLAVPAQNAAEGEGIDWLRTILPVGGATVLILAASLYLMRIWHRIDPS